MTTNTGLNHLGAEGGRTPPPRHHRFRPSGEERHTGRPRCAHRHCRPADKMDAGEEGRPAGWCFRATSRHASQRESCVLGSQEVHFAGIPRRGPGADRGAGAGGGP